MHNALKVSSGFQWATTLRDLNAAQAWGVPDPQAFYDLPKEARVKIIAWYEVKWRIDAITAYDHAEKMRLQSEKNQLKSKTRRKHKHG